MTRYRVQLEVDIEGFDPQHAADLADRLLKHSEKLAFIVTPYHNGALRIGDSEMVQVNPKPPSGYQAPQVVDGPTLEDAH